MTAMPVLMLSFARATAQRLGGTASREYLSACEPVLASMVGILAASIREEDEATGLLVIGIQALKLCVKRVADPGETGAGLLSAAGGGLLPDATVRGLFELLTQQMQQSLQRRSIAIAEARLEEYDEEQYEVEEERNEEEQMLLYQIADCVSNVASVFKHRCFTALEATLLPLVDQMAQPGSDPYHSKIAVYVIDDVVEHCANVSGGAHYAARYLPPFMAHLMRCAQSQDSEVRQPSFFGLGLVAQYAGGAVGDESIVHLVALLKACVGTAAMWESGVANAAENAVAAIGRVCEFRAATPGTRLTPLSHSISYYISLRDNHGGTTTSCSSSRHRRERALWHVALPPPAAPRHAGVEVDDGAAVPPRRRRERCAARRRRRAAARRNCARPRPGARHRGCGPRVAPTNDWRAAEADWCTNCARDEASHRHGARRERALRAGLDVGIALVHTSSII